jgi:DNA invertase Pin-like site-specific DNA recombinase/sRNA-binding carbon storage regulator CsrA
MNPKLTVDRLQRRAVVYIRQSSPDQVLHHLESQRLQYGLVEQARHLGFADVQVIDDDLGRSGDGQVERPGFEHLVAEVCSGRVGAVFCLEASRLARNGRDWHHLMELCGMVDAVVVDGDGIYDPTIINDRLLLGLKETMSEYELHLLRQRSLEARRQKARRGELEFHLPVGFCWNAQGKIEKDPDQRVQQAIELVFSKMTELGSVRQVLVWFRQQNISLPAIPRHREEPQLIWKPPVYRTVWEILTNPLYAGAYAYGRREVRTQIVEGRVRKSKGHRKPRSAWSVLIRDHHPGYVGWEQYERIQALIAENTHMKSNGEAKAGRGGRALLSGTLRCRRCGRMMRVSYVGKKHTIPRYDCNAVQLYQGGARCLSFSGLWVDEAVAKEVLEAIRGNAVEAALEAAEQMERHRHELRQSLSLEVEQARYEARLAARRYEAVDPDQRLVAAELEARWNAALQKTRELEQRLQDFDLEIKNVSLPSKELLLSLAQDLPAVWNSPSTDMRLKQRIIHILIEEIVADVDESRREIVLLIHWAGGRHSELRLKKREAGQHRWCTSVEAVEVVRQMAGRFTDEVIAATLNRLGMRTGIGNTWDKNRIYSLRQHHRFPGFDPQHPRTTVTLQEAARRLQVNEASVRHMIVEKKLPATQVVACAPWEIPVEALDSEEVRKRVGEIKSGTARPQKHSGEEQQTMFSIT